MTRANVHERLDRIEEKLDRVLAHFEGGESLPRPRPAAPAPRDPQDDPLWVDRCLFRAMHQFDRFPEALREWLHANPGRWTHAEILAGLSRRQPTARDIGGVRLGAFMRRHQEWLGVVREKEGKRTLWRLAGRSRA